MVSDKNIEIIWKSLGHRFILSFKFLDFGGFKKLKKWEI